jgi:hypothetical protein
MLTAAVLVALMAACTVALRKPELPPLCSPEVPEWAYTRCRLLAAWRDVLR